MADRTPSSSWAAEVEEEHEATGWNNIVKESISTESAAATKPTKAKKKKKKKKAASATATSPATNNSNSNNSNVGGKQVEAADNATEDHPPPPQFSDNNYNNNNNYNYNYNYSNSNSYDNGGNGSSSSQVWEAHGQNYSVESASAAPADNDGWEVQGGRSRDLRRRQQGANNNPNPNPNPSPATMAPSSTAWVRSDSFGGTPQTGPHLGRTMSGNRPQASWRNADGSTPAAGGFQRLNQMASSNGLNEKWETANRQKGKAQSYGGGRGIRDNNMQAAFRNDGWGNQSSSNENCWVSATSKPIGNPVAWSNVVNQGSQRKYPDKADGKSALQIDDSKRNLPVENPLLSKLLPNEKQGGTAISNVDNGPSSSSQVGGPILVEGYPSSNYSDSNLSDADLGGSDSDWMGSEESDSDGSEVDHEKLKQHKWFREFFDAMESLTNEQLNEADRQWHCPACRGGVGGIDWYRGLQPLLTHAQTVRSKRMKLHKILTLTLDEELKRRCTGHGLNGEGIYGKWKGLHRDDESTNPLIVWPPMVIIQNTKLELDDNEKWTGMGNKELLEMFKDYNAMKARHAYGPQGHRGISLLIFAESPSGYMDAQRLDAHFKDKSKGRENWDNPGKILFRPGGIRDLYGYTPNSEDMEIFNRHSGKAKVKYTMRRYNEAVVEPMRKMDQENLELNSLKKKLQKQKEENKTLGNTMTIVVSRLKIKEAELVEIRKRAKEQIEKNKTEMDFLEESYKERLSGLKIDTVQKEKELKKKEEEFKEQHIQHCQQLELKVAKIPPKPEEDQDKKQFQKYEEQIAIQSDLVERSLKYSEEYENEKRELTAKHHKQKLEFRRRQYEENLGFEHELEQEKRQLVDKYEKLLRDRGSLIGKEIAIPPDI